LWRPELSLAPSGCTMRSGGAGAADEDGQGAPGVVRHRRPLPGCRTVRREARCPGRAVPLPCVLQPPRVTVAAEQHAHSAERVEHHWSEITLRWPRRLNLRPGRAAVQPGV